MYVLRLNQRMFLEPQHKRHPERAPRLRERRNSISGGDGNFGQEGSRRRCKSLEDQRFFVECGLHSERWLLILCILNGITAAQIYF